MQFLANADKETISKAGVYASMYSGEVFSAYEMMVGQWVNKNESSVSHILLSLSLPFIFRWEITQRSREQEAKYSFPFSHFE